MRDRPLRIPPVRSMALSSEMYRRAKGDRTPSPRRPDDEQPGLTKRLKMAREHIWYAKGHMDSCFNQLSELVWESMAADNREENCKRKLKSAADREASAKRANRGLVTDAPILLRESDKVLAEADAQLIDLGDEAAPKLADKKNVASGSDKKFVAAFKKLSNEFDQPLSSGLSLLDDEVCKKRLADQVNEKLAETDDEVCKIRLPDQVNEKLAETDTQHDDEDDQQPAEEANKTLADDAGKKLAVEATEKLRESNAKLAEEADANFPETQLPE